MNINCFICHQPVRDYILGLKTHIKKFHSQLLSDLEKFECSFCGITFSNYSNLIRHIRAKHRQSEQLLDDTDQETHHENNDEIRSELCEVF